jgi:hypothetical protein
MPSKRKFYRTVIKVVVLSPEPYEPRSLSSVAYDVKHGTCSGTCSIVRRQTIGARRAAIALEEMGSDPAFFDLDADGNDLPTHGPDA